MFSTYFERRYHNNRLKIIRIKKKTENAGFENHKIYMHVYKVSGLNKFSI